MILMFATTPSPSPTVDLDSAWVVSPGIGGFAMFMVLAVAAWLLAMSMMRHVRKANFRAAEREAALYGPEGAPAARSEGAPVEVDPRV